MTLNFETAADMQRLFDSESPWASRIRLESTP